MRLVERAADPLRGGAGLLKKLADEAKDLGASVHMPRIGCGLAGGRWEEVEPIVLDELTTQGVEVTIYDLG